jgi:uncharacterized small protein (TIGR04563 family)
VSQKRKVTLYFNSAMLAETQKEAIRQDRSVSWIIQAAWRMARDEVKKMPATGIAMQTVSQDLVADETGPLPLLPPADTRSQA